MSGMLIIVSGPAGSGKNTASERLMASEKGLVRAVTTTTRTPREGEKNGEDYYFAVKEDFENGIKEDRFLEWAQVHGNYYGTERNEILKKLDSGKDVILIIDVQGAETWRGIAKKDGRLAAAMKTIFIKPESLEALRGRMSLRGDTPEDIEKRLETARGELVHEKFFDFCFTTKSREEDFLALKSLYEKLKSES